MMEVWKHLVRLMSETPAFTKPSDPYAAPQGAATCPMCGLPASRIKARGRLHIEYWHGRKAGCPRSFFTRGQRDRVLATYTPEQRGEAWDD
jgi:hypothetical protein